MIGLEKSANQTDFDFMAFADENAVKSSRAIFAAGVAIASVLVVIEAFAGRMPTLLTMVFFLFSSLIALMMIKSRYRYAARVFFFVAAQLSVFAVCDSSGKDSRTALYYLVLGSITFSMFPGHYLRTRILLILSSLALMVGSFLLPAGLVMPPTPITRLDPIVDMVGAFVAICVAAWASASRLGETAEAVQQREIEKLGQSRLIALGEVASGIAHEINNPLSILMSKVSSAKRRALESKSDVDLPLIEMTEKMSRRIYDIVRSLQSFSRNSVNDTPAECSFSDVLNDALVLCGDKLRMAAVDVTIELGDDPDAQTIFCRSGEVSQVLLNLISNSVDAIRERDERWIRIEHLQRDDSDIISITDSGEGIPDSVVNGGLMQPFFTTKTKGKGTGLGLSISRKLIERHGGRLEYDRSSRNTRFVLYLPKSNARVAA